jgi:hypothetical protein
VSLVIRRHLPGPSPTPIIAPGKCVTRSLGFLPRVTPVLPPSALSHLLDGWTAISLFRRRRPRFKSSIRSDATFGEGDATIDVRSLRSTANRMRCFCVNITPFFLSGTHARSWARNNRGPGRCRSRGEA